MRWIAISGSWRNCTKDVELDVRKVVREVMSRGDGIVVGGAPGVDYFATDESIKMDPQAKHVRIFLPTSLRFYLTHTNYRANEGVVKKDDAELLVKQLENVHKINPSAIVEQKDIPGNRYVEKKQYYGRNGAIVASADELIVNKINN